MKIPLTPLRVLTASILCAIPQASHAEVVVTPSEGFTLIWDGNDGDGFNPESPAPVPVNLANAQGAIPFTSSDLGPLRQREQLDRGEYPHPLRRHPPQRPGHPEQLCLRP